jgi:hypothetical protein
MIRAIDTKYTAEYIANVLWSKDIGKVSSITLIPQIINGKILNTAYITVASFTESIMAYELIIRMKSEAVEIIHDYEEESWFLERNTHNSGDICVGSYTTKFDDSFFYIEDNNDEYDEEPFEEIERPIKDMYGQKYSVREAEKYIEWLKNCKDDTDKNLRDEELIYLENELNIHKSVEKSQNVTVREKQSSVETQFIDWCNEQKAENIMLC